MDLPVPTSNGAAPQPIIAARAGFQPVRRRPGALSSIRFVCSGYGRAEYGALIAPLHPNEVSRSTEKATGYACITSSSCPVTPAVLSSRGIILHTSNQLEMLAGRLAAELKSDPASPLEPEVIIVQSQGMGRWLQLQLAARLGLCANVQFRFPRAFVHHVFHAFDPGIPEVDPNNPTLLTWQLWGLLPSLAAEPGGEPVRRYLHEDIDGRKRFQLAGRIARLFDDYAVFRPELVLGWDDGSDEHWQARLWRKLGAAHSKEHSAALRARFLERAKHAKAPPETLPRRVRLFGISALPPFSSQVTGATALSGQTAVIVPCPLRPVAFPILTRINIEWRARFGKTCTSSIHTRPVSSSWILPAIPFQLAPSESETLCASGR